MNMTASLRYRGMIPFPIQIRRLFSGLDFTRFWYRRGGRVQTRDVLGSTIEVITCLLPHLFNAGVLHPKIVGRPKLSRKVTF